MELTGGMIMKKQFVLIAAAVAALFAVSCVKENPVENAPVQGAMKEVTITASIDSETKTSYDADGVFSWHKGDQISVMDKQYKFHILTATASGTSVTFSGMVPEGTEFRQEAFFPADPGINRTDGSYYFNIPQYKDLTSGSADLPMGAYSGTETYVFKHITGAALLTFTNFPAEVETAEISIVNARLKLTGTFNAFLSSGLWTWNSKSDVAEEERTLIRKVPVVNGQAQIYMPYNGSLWWDYTSTINIIGYDADGNEYQLLVDKTMKADEKSAERGVITRYAPLELPAYVPPVNWEGLDWSSDDVVSPEKVGGLNYGKVLVDANYIYVNLQAPSTMAWDTIYCYFGWGEGTVDLGGFGWTTALLDSFRYKGVYAEGVISMPDAETKVVPADDNVNYYFAFKRNASATLSAAGEVYLGFHIYNGNDVPASFPKTWQGDNCALKITLP